MGRDRSGPGVRIELLLFRGDEVGQVVDLRDRLLSFEYEDTTRKLSKVKLTLNNQDLAFFEPDSPLLGGALLRISWGYSGRMSLPREVEIRKLKGFQTLTVEGLDLGSSMDRVEQTRVWENVKRSDVVSEIAKANGFGQDEQFIDDSEIVYETINQIGETDARMLRRLASLEDFEFYIDDRGIHWHDEKQGDAAGHVFEWYSDKIGTLISLNVDSDLIRRTGRSSSRGLGDTEDGGAKADNKIDATDGTTTRNTMAGATQVVAPEDIVSAYGLDEAASILEEIDADTGTSTLATQTKVTTAMKASARERFGDDPTRILGFGKSTSNQSGSYASAFAVKPLSIAEYGMNERQLLEKRRMEALASASMHADPPMPTEEAKRRAAARFKRAERRTIKLSATAVGDPTMRAGTVVEMRGIGSWLSGKYYLREIRHMISSSGYTMSMKLTGDGVNKAGDGAAPKSPEALVNDNPGFEIAEGGLVKVRRLPGQIPGSSQFFSQAVLTEMAQPAWYALPPGATIGDGDPVESKGKDIEKVST